VPEIKSVHELTQGFDGYVETAAAKFAQLVLSICESVVWEVVGSNPTWTNTQVLK
jgi:hypothetical protein